MFSTRLENFLPFSSNLKLSSAKSFILKESKNLSFGKGLISHKSEGKGFKVFVYKYWELWSNSKENMQ